MLYKRSKTGPYWVRFTIGKREIRVTSGTDRKSLAEEFERRLREQLWREIELGEVQHTWEEATERWLKEKAHKRSLIRDKEGFAAFEPDLRGLALHDIDGEALRKGAGRLLQRGWKPATVNRVLAAVKAVLNQAVRWGWLASAPKVEAQHVEHKDPRCISPEDFHRLAGELPEHLARMARFAVATGLRWSNISGLRWSMVDLERSVAHIPGDQTKSRRAIPVPLSAGARDALLVSRSGEGGSPEADAYVFRDHLGRAPIGSCKTAWLKAVKRAGLQGFRFHDLRHTWAAWHTMNGTPAVILKELGGWSSLAMVERYSALNPGHLAGWADNTSRTKNGTEVSEK